MEVYDTGAGGRAGVAKADLASTEVQYVNPPALFDGSRLFTQVIVVPAGSQVYISGLIGCGPDNRLVTGEMAGQMRQAFDNLRAALAAVGGAKAIVVKLCAYVVDHDDSHLVLLRAELERLFADGRYPTLTLVPVPRLGRTGALFEIDAIAAVQM